MDGRRQTRGKKNSQATAAELKGVRVSLVVETRSDEKLVLLEETKALSLLFSTLSIPSQPIPSHPIPFHHTSNGSTVI